MDHPLKYVGIVKAETHNLLRKAMNVAMYTMKIFTLMLTLLSFSSLAGIDLVKVDKSENKMYLLEDGKIIKEYRVAFGGNPKGHKEQEGDKKTPEGTYTLDYKKEDSAFYRSMHISYPNQKDLDQAKKKGVSAGGLIMVHGQRNTLQWSSKIIQRFNWTNGCIALTNNEMDEFMLLVNTGTKIKIQW
jgi:murein L,D-transpeptidase YafK